MASVISTIGKCAKIFIVFKLAFKMKRLFKFRYPKILGLIIAIVLAYLIFRNPAVSGFVSDLGDYGYLGVFIAGILFAFGFTAPFAVGFFVTLNPANVWLAGIVGGLGSLTGDMMLFKCIRFSFEDEFYRLEHTKVMKEASELIEKSIGKKFQLYLMYALAGFFIASPLPDEAGVIMLAGLTRIKLGTMMKLSFLLNTAGIIILLLI